MVEGQTSERGTELAADVDLNGVSAGSPRAVDLHDPKQREAVEFALRELPGILATRIVPGYERHVDELHVLASLDKSPKQLVRDIQSILMARYGVTTDHRVISIVQLDERTSPFGPPRVVLARVTAAQQGLEVHVEVVLSEGDRELVGTAAGPASASGRRRTTARAALEAIRPLLGTSRVVEVEGVAVQSVLGHTVALSFLHFHTTKGDETVSGSALARHDETEAVARSVLDALNREMLEAAP